MLEIRTIIIQKFQENSNLCKNEMEIVVNIKTNFLSLNFRMTLIRKKHKCLLRCDNGARVQTFYYYCCYIFWKTWLYKMKSKTEISQFYFSNLRNSLEIKNQSLYLHILSSSVLFSPFCPCHPKTIVKNLLVGVGGWEKIPKCLKM